MDISIIFYSNETPIYISIAIKMNFSIKQTLKQFEKNLDIIRIIIIFICDLLGTKPLTNKQPTQHTRIISKHYPSLVP